MVPFSLAVFLIISIFAIRTTAASPSTPTPSARPSVLTQHILHPAHKDLLVPGSLTTIRWTANTHFKNVTLQLWDNTSWGYSHDLLSPCFPWGRNSFCGTIATHAPNTGSFDWYIPNPANGSLGHGFPRDEQVFWVKIFVEDYLNDEVGNARPVVSWSQNFAFAGEGERGSVVGDEVGGGESGDGVPVYVADGTSSSSAAAATSMATATASQLLGKAAVPVARGGAYAVRGRSWLMAVPSLLLALL